MAEMWRGRKIRTLGRSDSDLDKLLAGLDRSRDLVMRMFDGAGAAAKAAPSAFVQTRSQFRSGIRASGGMGGRRR